MVATASTEHHGWGLRLLREISSLDLGTGFDHRQGRNFSLKSGVPIQKTRRPRVQR